MGSQLRHSVVTIGDHLPVPVAEPVDGTMGAREDAPFPLWTTLGQSPMMEVVSQSAPQRPADPLEELGLNPPGPAEPFSKPEGRIALIYALCASLWIVFSDKVLAQWVTSHNLTHFQTFKGLYFVAMTTLILYWVLRRAFGGWRYCEDLRLNAMRSSLERFRSLSSNIQHLREEERTRISREIHDELGQLLTGVKMHLRLIEDHLGNHADQSVNPAIDELVEAAAMVDETLVAVRRIASGLRPAALDHLGLVAALKEEAEQFSRRTSIDCQLSVTDMEAELPPEVETAAFRIFQESLTNVARHAAAGHIEASCSASGDVLKLIVADDGVGIDPKMAGYPDSLGLVGMLERAADVGGTVEFKTAAGEGTKVTLSIPLGNNRNFLSVGGS